jgi:hypothetical protein
MSLGVSSTFTRCSRSALLLLGVAGLLINGTHLLAQNAPIPFLAPNAANPVNRPHDGHFLGVEVLTDTGGVDLSRISNKSYKRFLRATLPKRSEQIPIMIGLASSVSPSLQTARSPHCTSMKAAMIAV